MSLEDELLGLIAARIAGHERSQQLAIGPSGLGTPCNRKLGFRLAQIPPLPGGEPPWRPTVGTAVHTWLQHMIVSLNKEELSNKRIHDTSPSDGELCMAQWCNFHIDNFPRHNPRFDVEVNIPVGTINGREIRGTLDLWDGLAHTIVDWKVPGPKAIKDHRAYINKHGHVTPEYRTQLHVYGRGAIKAGYPVEHVAIMFLPMNGELSEALYWEEDYDPAIGTEAFHRARTIDAAGQGQGWDKLLPRLKTVNDHCGHCPWFAPGTENPLECRGDESLWAQLTPPDVESLLE